MTQEYGSTEAELLALEQKRAQYVLASTLAVIFLAAVLFWSDNLAGPVVAVIVTIGIGKGFVTFRDCGKRMKELRQLSEPGTTGGS